MFYAEKLKKLRKERGLTLRELEKEIGVSRAYLNEIERGIREPTLRVLDKLTSFYKVEPEVFFMREKRVRYLVEKDKEAQLIRYFRRLSSENQEKVVKFCKFLVWDEKGKV